MAESASRNSTVDHSELLWALDDLANEGDMLCRNAAEAIRGLIASRSELRTLPKEGPRRACVLTVLLEADSKEDMLHALSSLEQALARDELTKGVWGSPSNGCIYEYSQGSTPTHDEYFEQTRAYLEQLRASSSERNGS